MNKIEIWKDIPGYEQYYMVSSLGNVKSKDRYRKNGKGGYVLKGRILKQSLSSTGYKKVELCVNGNKKSLKVHRLVGLAFINNPYNKPFINHIDGNPVNNNVSNLEWVTNRENIIHALDTGLKKINALNKEELTDLYINKKFNVVEIAELLNTTGAIVRTNLKRYGINPRGLSDVKNQYNLTHEWVIEQLKTKTQKQLAFEVGCDPSLISKYKNNKIKGDKGNGK